MFVSWRVKAAFIGPAVAYFGVFLLVPVLAALGFAWTKWSGIDLGQATWNGTGNFTDLVGDVVFKKALVHTLIFVVVSTVFVNLIGLALAMLINTRVRGHDFLRVAMFVPLALSPVIVAVLWQYLLGPYGLVNQVLGGVLGVAEKPVSFLGDPSLAFSTVIAASIWQFAGGNMLLYYAGLQGLPQERMEAAAIDGAGWWSRVRWVVLPHLRPTIAVVVILNMIGGWKVFDLVYVLTKGGPNRSTEVLSTYLYEQAFTLNNVGYASAIACVICLLAIVSTLVRRPIAGLDY
ncbi:MAG: sugar ABC transporter permease [Conexibacter sp.]